MSSQPLDFFSSLTILAPFLVTVVLGVFYLRENPDSVTLTRRRKWVNEHLNLLTIAAALVSVAGSIALLPLILNQPDHQSVAFPVDNTKFPLRIRIDGLSTYFLLIVNVVNLFVAVRVDRYLGFIRDLSAAEARTDRKHTRISEVGFHFALNLFHLSMVLVTTLDNLVLIWIMIQVTTLSSAVLVGYRHDRLSLEAAWKYIMITSAGIAFALVGTVLFMTAFEGSLSMNWSEVVSHVRDLLDGPGVGTQVNQQLIKFAFLLVLVGYGTKAGVAPLHTWLPDGHGQGPYPISALLSGVLLKSALYAILRFYSLITLIVQDAAFPNLMFLLIGLASLVIATFLIIKDNPLKRVLAYHSLEHMGIISFGFGLGLPLAMYGALFHAFNHAITKALMFLSFGPIQYNYEKLVNAVVGRDQASETDTELWNPTGVLRTMPAHGTILVWGGLALIGMPPFGIFFSELIILWSSLRWAVLSGGGTWWSKGIAVVLFVASLVLIFMALLNHLGKILLGPFDRLITINRKSEGFTEQVVWPLDDAQHHQGMLRKEDHWNPWLLGLLTLMGLAVFFIMKPLNQLLQLCVENIML